MILADKITEERKRNGWSQEELAEKLGISRQAVSKWESAGSIPDLQRIIQLSELFGVSTDYLLKDEMDSSSYISAEVTEAEPVYRVSIEEANLFLDTKKKSCSYYRECYFYVYYQPGSSGIAWRYGGFACGTCFRRSGSGNRISIFIWNDCSGSVSLYHLRHA